MAQLQLIEKINFHLQHHQPFATEADVLYVLVESRKILDHNNDHQFPVLRFFCDWSVHTSKDRITGPIRNIMQVVYSHRYPVLYAGIPMYQNFTLADFFQMQYVKHDLEQFLPKYGISESLLTAGHWPHFIHHLVNILADQPLNSPCMGIESLRFLPSPFGAVIAQIRYSPGSISPEVQSFATAY